MEQPPEELNQRWSSFQPIDGVAFLLNDAIRVRTGPKGGSTGSVISLLALTPEPRYLVELASGAGDGEFDQSELESTVPEDTADAIAALQSWYSRQCDGDWEHDFGVSISTLDNPGWSIRIPLTGTLLANVGFEEVVQTGPERTWITCRVKDGWFEGFAGPHMLGQLVATFARWARQNGAA